MSAFHALLVFLVALLADICWARWSMAAADRHAWLAAFWAVAIIFAGVFSIDAYITSRWYVLPSALGAGVGTYIAVKGKR